MTVLPPTASGRQFVGSEVVRRSFAAEQDRASAHSRYNALVGWIVSFARAAEHARPS